MAVLFHELAADEGARAVRRAAGRLPMFPHDARPGGECFRFFHDALQVREGGKNEIKNQEGPVFHVSPAEGPEKEQGKEGIEDGRSFKEKFIVHDARAEKETACHHAQRDVVQRVFPAFWEEERPRQQYPQGQGQQEAGVFDGIGMEQKPLLPVMVDFRIFCIKQAGELPSSVQMGIKDGHDGRAQGREPENRLAQKGTETGKRFPCRREAEQGFIRHIRKEQKGAQRGGRQQKRSREIIPGGRQGARQDEYGAQ